MIVTNPKLHDDWREDWEGTHMRRVGNNWRITLHMRCKKKAHGEVLEHMVLCGIVNLVILLTYRLYGKKNETVLELYWKFNAANSVRHSSFHRYASRRTHRRGVTEESWN